MRGARIVGRRAGRGVLLVLRELVFYLSLSLSLLVYILGFRFGLLVNGGAWLDWRMGV